MRRLMRRSIAAVMLTWMGVFPLACRRPVAKPPLDAVVQQYLELCVALGERDVDSLDFYIGPATLTQQVRRDRPTSPEIARQAAALRDRIDADLASPQPVMFTAAERDRGLFLRAQLDALRLRAEVLAGKTVSVDEEGQVYFGVTAPPDTGAAERAQTRAAIAKLLGGEKDLAHRYSLYERGFVVHADRVPAVMAAALAQCRAATLRHIAMPPGERVEVQYVSHQPWAGFSRYLGHGHSVIQINMDFPLTVDELLGLACHEGYPGHHVFNTLREQALVGGAQEPEWEAQPTFSPQSFVSEGAASYALRMAFSAEERLRVERDVLFPIAGLAPSGAARYVQVARLVDSLDSAESGIARDYLSGRLEYERADEAFERETLMEHADSLLLYLNEYRSYMLTYTVGKSLVERLVEQGSPAEDVRWQRYAGLMQRPVYKLDGVDVRGGGQR
jgi:hypothetical protein